VRQATAADTQRAALEYLKASNRTVGEFIPGEPDRAVIPPAPNLTKLLEGYKGDKVRAEGEEFDASPANIDKRTTRVALPGGVKLAMLPKQTRGDAVSASIRLNFGSVQSLVGNGRIAPIAADMLMRGTTTKTRQQIEDQLAKLKSQLSVGGGGDGVGASIVSTRENLAAVVALAIDVLREPSFPPGELETLRASALAGLEASKSEPQAIVQRAYARHWDPYKADDVRYVPTVDEQRDFLTKVSVKDLADFHAAFYGASNAEVVIVGDFDPKEIQALIASKLDGWKSPKPYSEVHTPYPDPPISPIEQTFETPDKQNAFFMAGMPVKMSDADPDYPAMVLGNYIFGQGTNSRLFSRIRGREGLSYGVGSQFQAPTDSDGARFVAFAISAPQNTDKVEASFRDELTKVLRDGYTDQEVATAKDAWGQARQVSRSQDRALTGMLLSRLHEDRTMAWDSELEQRVRALTPAAIREAMQRHLDPAQLAFMKGGDFASVAKETKDGK
jgi:zinc protease